MDASALPRKISLAAVDLQIAYRSWKLHESQRPERCASSTLAACQVLAK